MRIRAVIFDMYETLITHYACPLYFSTQMAQDAGISAECFQALWVPTEEDQSIGKVTMEEVLERILRETGCYSRELFKKIVEKRIETKRECFRHLHPEIIPMLQRLRKGGVLVGLISNCFSEEAKVIRESELFPYFDAVCLSYEQGCQKPDPEIYRRCMTMLSVKPQECLYIGDGGSHELETARILGMTAVQAAWYLKEGTLQPVRRLQEFPQFETPLAVPGYLEI